MQCCTKQSVAFARGDNTFSFFTLLFDWWISRIQIEGTMLVRKRKIGGETLQDNQGKWWRCVNSWCFFIIHIMRVFITYCVFGKLMTLRAHTKKVGPKYLLFYHLYSVERWFCRVMVTSTSRGRKRTMRYQYMSLFFTQVTLQIPSRATITNKPRVTTARTNSSKNISLTSLEPESCEPENDWTKSQPLL